MAPHDARLRIRMLFAGFVVWSALFLSRDFVAARKIDDGAQYLLIAKGFAEGAGYVNEAFPGIPAFVQLPSAFPLMLVPYWWFIAPHEFWLYLGLAAAMGLGAWMAFLWLRGFLPQWQAFLVALAFTAHFQVIILASSVMTEAPFVLLLYSGLYFTARTDPEGGGDGDGRRMEGWLALLCWLVLFRLRINTMPFLLVHLAVLARRRDWSRLAAGVVAAGLWIGFEKSQSLPTGGGSYVEYGIRHVYPFDTHPWQAAARLAADYAHSWYGYVGSIFGRQVFPLFYYLHAMDPAKRLLILGLSAWCAWGMGIFWKDHARYRAMCVALLLHWAPIFIYSRTVDRYMLPTLPLLLACLLLPLGRLPARFRPGRVAAACLALVIVNQAAYSLTFRRWSDYWTGERAAYRDLHAFIRSAPSRPDLLVALNPYYTYLETGIPTVAFERQWDFVRLHGIADGKKIWGMFSVPATGAPADIRPGEGFCLGERPLAGEGEYALYEVGPCAAGPEGPLGR